MHHTPFIALLVALTSLTCCCTAQNRTAESPQHTTRLNVRYTPDDSTRVTQLLTTCSTAPDSLPATIIHLARQFMGTPYVAATLEGNDTEQLVVNLRELDCTTFVENVTALARCVHNQQTSFDDFCNALTTLRYRNGIIDGYPSRLHYFTEWLLNNRSRNLIELPGEQFAPALFSPSVSFMSTHPDKYKALTANPAFVPLIARAEQYISQQQLRYIPKERLAEYEGHLREGDIIAITTAIPGLDISHVGIACFVNQRLHMIHASSTLKKVVITDKPLADYLAGIRSNTGIVVARVRGEKKGAK